MPVDAGVNRKVHRVLAHDDLAWVARQRAGDLDISVAEQRERVIRAAARDGLILCVRPEGWRDGAEARDCGVAVGPLALDPDQAKARGAARGKVGAAPAVGDEDDLAGLQLGALVDVGAEGNRLLGRSKHLLSGLARAT